MIRLGVLGGTFDPLHIAHLVMADQACGQLNLERILFVPAGHPPHKLDRVVSSVEHRVTMTQLAIAGDARFELSRVDVDRPGPHYTADMLALLRASHPESALYLLVGSDSLRDLATWHDPARVIAQARLAVMRRPGGEPDWHSLEVLLPGIAAQVDWLDAPWLDVSSTDIQRRVRAGLSIQYLVTEAVERYIVQQELYHSRSDVFPHG
jgi:nicotinate-nucleotide adenylyltransferase